MKFKHCEDISANNKKPHVHAEMIKAWADGADIEYQAVSGEWFHINSPAWYANDIYRIKLKKTPGQLLYEVFVVGRSNWEAQTDPVWRGEYEQWAKDFIKGMKEHGQTFD